MTAQTESQPTERLEDGAVFDAPLNRLKKSPRNARRAPHSDAAVEAMAASIAAKRVLQAPVVEPEVDEAGGPTGFYLVTIGECRRLALNLLAKRKTIKKTHPVRCVLDLSHDPHEISLDETGRARSSSPSGRSNRLRGIRRTTAVSTRTWRNRSRSTAEFGFTATGFGSCPRIVVGDTGPGVDRDDVGRLFQLFFTKRSSAHRIDT